MTIPSSPLFIGIMSGTSADGIDVAIVRLSEQTELLHFSEYPMPAKLRQAILRLASPGYGDNFSGQKNYTFAERGDAPRAMDGPSEVDNMGGLDKALGHVYADAALAAIKAAGLQSSDISVIGNHGQTIRHRPDTQYPFTLQIGCAATIAEQTGITTVSNFRSRDMAAGGEGAPLVPFAHQQLFSDTERHTVVLNIGGIANITWLGADGSVAGFDTGPGNMMMDSLMQSFSRGEQRFDKNGQLAASGSVDLELLNKLMQHPFLQQTPPKSTGREQFGDNVVGQILNWPDISDADRMATACRLTADSICSSVRFLQATPARWLCCGGGVRNQHLMTLLKMQLAPASVSTTEDAGMPPQAVEAVSFALLARQTLLGETNTLSAVTGATHNVCGGQITPGDNWQTLLQNMPSWIR